MAQRVTEALFRANLDQAADRGAQQLEDASRKKVPRVLDLDVREVPCVSRAKVWEICP